MKRFIAVFLSLIMAASVFTVSASAELVNNDEPASLSISSSNSLDDMINEEYTQSVREYYSGCTISSLEMSDKRNVKVEYTVNKAATLIVAFYTDDCSEMVMYRTREITASDSSTVFGVSGLPDYFYIKACLVSTESGVPLCKAFNNPNYTKRMQEFLSKSVDDYDSENVMNLDDNDTTNYAVFKDGVKKVESDGKSDILESQTDGTYAFRNPDKLYDVTPGDILAYHCGEELIIINVSGIDENDSCLMITGEQAEGEKVFEAVRIDGVATDENTEFISYGTDTSGKKPAGSASSKSKTPTGMDFNKDGKAFSGNIDIAKISNKTESDYATTNVEGGISFSVTPKLKYYRIEDYKYLEAKIDYTASLDTSISASMKVTIPLCKVKFRPVVGVKMSFTPSVVLSCTGELDYSVSLNGTLGVQSDTDSGCHNISRAPSFKAEVKSEVKLFAGISLEPEIEVLWDVVEAGMDATIGAEINAKYDKMLMDTDAEEFHECKRCLEGKAVDKLTLNFTVDFFKKTRKLINGGKEKQPIFSLEINPFKNAEVELFRFHYSEDYNEFDFCECPHFLYRQRFTLSNSEKKLESKNITVNGKDAEYPYSSASGKTAVFYLPNGSHEVSFKSTDGLTAKKSFTVNSKAADYKITLSDEDYMEKFINILVSKKSEWFSGRYSTYGAQFVDLDFDNRPEFISQWMSGSSMSVDGEVYYLDDNDKLCKAEGNDNLLGRGFTNRIKLYKNKKDNTYSWLGSATLRAGISGFWSGLFELFYKNHKLSPKYYVSSELTRTTKDNYKTYTEKTTYYNGAKKYGNTSGCKKIKKSEYDKLKKDKEKNYTKCSYEQKMVLYDKIDSAGSETLKDLLRENYLDFMQNAPCCNVKAKGAVKVTLTTKSKKASAAGKGVKSAQSVTVKSKTGYATKTVSYSNLKPGTIYNFYVLGSTDVTPKFKLGNVYYFNQYAADKNGNLSFSYASDDGKALLVEMKQETAANSTNKAVTKKKNPMKITVKKKTISLKKLKKKAQKVKPIKVTKNKGKVKYKLITKKTSKKIRKLVKISSKGTVTVNRWKKAKKGTYKIGVKITAKGTSKYKSKSVTRSVKIIIK